MVITTMTEFRGSFTDLCNRVIYGNERIVVTKNDKPSFAIIPVRSKESLEQIERLLDRLLLEEALADVEKEGTVSMEEAKRQLGLQKP